jgi:hypothetical protein
LREATLAAELLCSGVTTLRKAATPRSGLYELAMFNLSMGCERICKLIVLLDYRATHKSAFPSNDVLKNKYGHDLAKLFPAVAQIVADRHITGEYTSPPDSAVHKEIISTLAEFAKTTRYYNLDYLTGGKAAQLQSGSAAWIERVGRLILQKHYSPRKQVSDVIEAQQLQASMGQMVSGIRFDEAGKSIDTLEQGLIHGAEIRLIQRLGPFYCLQLGRYLAAVLDKVRSVHNAADSAPMPFFVEIFAPFLNNDQFLKSRKTWTVPG